MLNKQKELNATNPMYQLEESKQFTFMMQKSNPINRAKVQEPEDEDQPCHSSFENVAKAKPENSPQP